MKKLLLLLLVFMFCATTAYAGTSYYVDLDAGSSGSGTYASPWNSIADVNGASLTTGDDVYFKVGTMETLSANAYLNIDWVGTSEDWVIVGAYSGDGVFELGSGGRPEINGNHLAPGIASAKGLINREFESKTDTYTEIRDIKLVESGMYGISLNRCSNVNIKNVYVYRAWQPQGIGVFRSDTVTIGGAAGDGNTVEQCNYKQTGNGSSITSSGMSEEGLSFDNIISYNRVKGCYGSEGINIVKKDVNCLIEWNVVRDQDGPSIYGDAALSPTIRFNTIYNSTTSPSSRYGISLNNEEERGYFFLDHARVYGNKFGNMDVAISFSSEYGKNHPSEANRWEAIRAFNNTSVDCNEFTFQFWHQEIILSPIKIFNNISYLTGDTAGAHSNDYTLTNVTWDYNNFSSSVSGDATSNAVIGVPTLNKTSGWTTIAPDTEDITWWNLEVGSNCIDAGMHLTDITTTEGSNTTVIVDDPYFFIVGDYMGIDNGADGTVDFIALITAVDYATGVITLNSAHIYTSGGDVYLVPSATVSFFGTDQDIGAYEYTPVVSISASDLSGTEVGPGTASITVDCANCTGGETVAITLTGTATEVTDYAVDDKTDILYVELPKTITFTPEADTLCEGDETIIFTLNTPVGCVLGSEYTATMIITDDDAGDCGVPDPGTNLNVVSSVTGVNTIYSSTGVDVTN